MGEPAIVVEFNQDVDQHRRKLLGEMICFLEGDDLAFMILLAEQMIFKN